LAVNVMSVDTAVLDRTERERVLENLDREVRAPLTAFAMKLTWGDRQWAEDVVQETLLRAWHHADRLPEDPEQTRPWLFTVARRIVVDNLRANAARPQQVPATCLEYTADAGHSPEHVVSVRHLRAAIRGLSAQHRRVLFEVYYQDRSTAETAKVLGVPAGTVKSRVHHAIRVLRQAFDQDDAYAR
jgi:RNA polymerase sigma-70 factor (ECF subfamily)